MSNLILNIACSVQMSQVARTTLLKALSRNASMALAKPAEDLTLVLNCDSGMMVQGKFGPAALVRRSSQPCHPVHACTLLPRSHRSCKQMHIPQFPYLFSTFMMWIASIQNDLRNMQHQTLARAAVHSRTANSQRRKRTVAGTSASHTFYSQTSN